MQAKQINFKKARDFGDLLGDTFGFLKQEYKFLLKVLLTYAGPFVLITSIAAAWMQSGMFSIMTRMVSHNPAEVLGEFGLKMLIYIVAIMVSTTVLISTIYSYIKLYVEKGKDGFVQEEVWQNVQKKFFPMLGTMIIMGFIIGIGFIFCIIPGVYFFVVFACVYSCIFFENIAMGKAFQRSMALVGDDFWLTLGIGIVISLIVGLASYIFILPSSILSVFVMASSVQSGTSETLNIVYMVITTLCTFCVSLLGAVPQITLGLLYHSQIEKKESPGLLNKIEQINQPQTENEDKLKF
jgi:hypothetical protein